MKSRYLNCVRRIGLWTGLSLGLGFLFTAHTSLADYKSLQVLPKNITKDQLKPIMKAQSKALGVDCDHCHEIPNAEKDTEKKKVARQMMKMVAELNAHYMKDMKSKVTCATCHRGKAIPDEVSK